MNWGSGEVGKWGNSTKTPKPQPPTPKTCLLSPESCLLNPMVDVGFLQEFYFPTKISKNYLFTAKLENI
ncbi:hypothetical protein N0824_03567 [Microcystis sp. 0824]|nr:hypothetical protein N0824_03567 [Microcystis sp. 0824]